MVKVAFITCVNNIPLYKKCLAHLALLDKKGFEVEYIHVEDSSSITRAYNKAMRSSNAKYKIYLHQDVFIVEPLFLHKIHYFFSRASSIGMIGMMGGRGLPMEKDRVMCWSDCRVVFGNVYAPTINAHLKFLTDKPFERATVIDGLLMATQHDVPWREDIIDGFHFYDKSQSMEFNKRGLKVIVPRMEKHWVIHWCEMPDIREREYVRLKNKFLNEYRYYPQKEAKSGGKSFVFGGKRYTFI